MAIDRLAICHPANCHRPGEGFVEATKTLPSKVSIPWGMNELLSAWPSSASSWYVEHAETINMANSKTNFIREDLVEIVIADTALIGLE